MAGLVVKYQYSNDMELLDIVLQLYAKTELKVDLSHKEHCILREYLTHGYSEKTKKSLIQSLFLPNGTDKKDEQDKIKAFNRVFSTQFKVVTEINEFISKGVEDGKKEEFLKEYKKERYKRASSNLNVINYTLKEKGFLEPHPTNQRLKIVAKKLLILNENFLNTNKDEKLCLIIDFQNQSTSKKI